MKNSFHFWVTSKSYSLIKRPSGGRGSLFIRCCLYHAPVFLETAFSALHHLVLPELLVECPTGDAETAGGLALVASRGIQSFQYRFPLDDFEGMAFGGFCKRRCRSCKRASGSRREG